MAAKDKTGMKFGILTAIERIANYTGNGRTYYKCQCDCGNICYVPTEKVGKKESCGCTFQVWNKKDITGNRYGRLIVEEMLYGYKKGHTYCKCKCDCGNETIVDMGNLSAGKTKSCGCLEKESRYGRENHEKNLLGMRFGMLEVIEKTDKRYANGNVGWLCKCDCGNEKIVRSGNLLRTKTRSCGCKKTSKYEEYVEEILDDLKIDYDREHTFPDCKNVQVLPFDFYLEYKDKRICIECQGQQHYESIEHFGGEERLQVTQNNDKIKKNYCEGNDIILICLPYTLSKEEMREEILNVLDPVEITAA